MAEHAQELTLESVGAAPLTFDYWLTPLIDFRTTVTGTNRDNATVVVYYVTTPLGSATLTQLAPNAKLPDMQAGIYKISDAGLALTVPGPTTDGSVVLTCTVTAQGQEPIKASLPIASWPLKSST